MENKINQNDFLKKMKVARENINKFATLPFGSYYTLLEKAIYKPSAKGKEMVQFVYKVLEGDLREKIFSSMKTGLTMTITTLVALTVGILVTNAEVIRQMFTIIIIGLLFDVLSTYIMNVWILKKYMERKYRG